MFIERKGDIYFISKIESPYRVWYPILLDIALYSDDYVRSKLGVTDPIQQRDLRIEFYEAIRNSEIKTDEVEYHALKINNVYLDFYLHEKTDDSVTVFIEKGLYTLYEGGPDEIDRPPAGNAWAIIDKSDTPEDIMKKFYDTEIEFEIAFHEKLRKIMNW